MTVNSHIHATRACAVRVCAVVRCSEYYLLSPERTTLMGTNIRNKIDVNFELEMHPIGVGKENYERLQI